MTIKEWAEEYDRLVVAGGEWTWPEWICIAAEAEPELTRLIVGPFKPTPENFIKACRLADEAYRKNQAAAPRISLAEARSRALVVSRDVDRARQEEAKLNAIMDMVVDQEVLLAGLVAQAQEAAANRPAEGLCPAAQIGLPVVPDPKSPQPPPSGVFRGRYKTRAGRLVTLGRPMIDPDYAWDAHGNHESDPALDLMRRIWEGEGPQGSPP